MTKSGQRSYRFLVFSNAVVGKEAELMDWLDNRHSEELLGVDGFIAVQQFELSDAFGQTISDETPYRFITMWEIETDDIDAVWERAAQGRREGRIVPTDAMVRPNYKQYWEPRTERTTLEMLRKR